MSPTDKGKLDGIYESILQAYQINASDDEPTKITKLLSEASISEESAKRYIKGLEQLVNDLKTKIVALETALQNANQEK